MSQGPEDKALVADALQRKAVADRERLRQRIADDEADGVKAKTFRELLPALSWACPGHVWPLSICVSCFITLEAASLRLATR